MSSSPHEDTRAHVSLPAEVRPLLDRAQEALEAPSWASTVQTLLEAFVEPEGAGEAGVDMEALRRTKAAAVEEALARVSDALRFVLDAAGLGIGEETIGDAIRAAAADDSPVAFSRFALELTRAADCAGSSRQLDALAERIDELAARVEGLHHMLDDRPAPHVVVKNADADADADAEADTAAEA